MTDFNTLLQDFACDDCALVFFDYKQFLLHRKHHISSFRSVITEETLLEESCPLCFEKYSEKYRNICLEELLGSGKVLRASELMARAKHVMRCKHYPKCRVKFSGFFEYVKHLKEVHNDDQPYACQQCNFSTPRYRELRKHLFDHVGYKMFKCHLCVKEYATKEGLKHHLLVHKDVDINSHDCPHCSKKCSTPSELRGHLRVHVPSTETFKCHLCPKEFSHKRSLMRHIKRHSNAHEYLNTFICSICSMRFLYAQSLKRHELRHTGKQSFGCSYCDKKFFSSIDRKKHQIAHLHKPYDCEHCGHQFLWEASLQRHRDPEKETKYASCCKMCPKKFKNFNCFLYHQRSHRGISCDVCQRNFFSSRGFKMHLKAHGITATATSCSKKLVAEEISSLKKEFKCAICPKEYCDKQAFKNHLLKHEGKEPFDCKDCGKKFLRVVLLKKHLNPEKESKHPLCCKECSKIFNNINCLKHHRRSHMEELFCEVCHEKFFTRDGLRRHLANHTSNWDPKL